MSLVDSDYFLFLDADEYFEREITRNDIEELINLIEYNKVDGIRFVTSNFDFVSGVPLYDSYNIKFIKNDKNLKQIFMNS